MLTLMDLYFFIYYGRVMNEALGTIALHTKHRDMQAP